MSNYKDFNEFISNTFIELSSEKKDENQVLLFQEWENSIHKDARFYEVIELKNSNWKIRFTKWEIGKDTPRFLNPLEKVKWRGKILPTTFIKENLLSESEKLSLQKKIDEVRFNYEKEIHKGYLKTLKIKNKENNMNFSWNENNEVEKLILDFVDQLKIN
ncbi:hypothetical protein ACOSP6_00070 [Tenacibaculum sp. MEBiC06402]|uniref:hypothetical protein n=1 Tax=unclassified Tenacibaculum TaxID=2635139 RepID=UPI003B9938F9